MKKMKLLLALSACAVLAFPATACTPPVNENEFEEGKYNITVACQSEENEEAVMEKLATSYEAKNPDVNVIVKNFGSSDLDGYMQNYAWNEDKLANIVWVPDDKFAPWAAKGHFLDLRPMYEASKETSYELYYESMLHAASYTGEYKPYSVDKSEKHALYYAPRDYNKIGICYNTDLFEDFGIYDLLPEDFSHENWNMDTFITFLQGVSGKIKEAGAAYSASYDAINLFLQWEPVYTSVFKEMGSSGILDANYDLNLKSAENRQILSKLYDELFSDKTMIGTEDGFKQGYTAMTVCVRPVAYTFYSVMKGKVDFLPFPTEAVGAGCSGYAITTRTADKTQKANGVEKTNKELCWDFIKYIISEEGQEVAGEFGTSVPILKSLKDNGSWTKAMNPNLNHSAWLAGEELRLMTYNVFKPDARPSLRSCVDAIINKQQSVDEGTYAKMTGWLDTYTTNFNRVNDLL